MRLVVTPGGRIGGEVEVPGDKSISHRWLLLAATAEGTTRLANVPRSLDVASTASCLSLVAPAARPALEVGASRSAVTGDRHGSTWNRETRTLEVNQLEVHGEGRSSLVEPSEPLDCGNSGTTMRLLTGLLAGSPFTSVLVGDRSLSSRPMERVARPLRAMGATVRTNDGRPPVTVRGAALHGIRFEADVPSAQVKGAVLLAGLAAEGETRVVEPVLTRDHTERALAALGATIATRDGVALEGPFQHGGFDAIVPGDVSSAAFLVAAAILTGGNLTIHGVGLNPTRLHFLDVIRRMGVRVDVEIREARLGEPVGTLRVRSAGRVAPIQVGSEELPLVIDEVPALAALAVHADGASRFDGAGELRVKESDRLAALVDGIAALGGEASTAGDGLLLGGGGCASGTAWAAGDHRIAMGLAVAALAARGRSTIEGFEASAVSFPGVAEVMAALGAHVEEMP